MPWEHSCANNIWWLWTQSHCCHHAARIMDATICTGSLDGESGLLTSVHITTDEGAHNTHWVPLRHLGWWGLPLNFAILKVSIKPYSLYPCLPKPTDFIKSTDFKSAFLWLLFWKRYFVPVEWYRLIIKIWSLLSNNPKLYNEHNSRHRYTQRCQ